MGAKPLISFISIVSLLLIQACNSSGGGGGSNAPANKQSSEAAITSLILSISDVDQTIDLADDNKELTAYYPYGDSTPDSVMITSISVSADATADVSNDQTVDLVDGKITITVTAQDGTEQTYTVSFNELQMNNEAHITSLIISVSGVDQTIDLAYDNRELAAYYPYGDSTPDSVMITSIAVSAYATTNVSDGQEINLVDGRITITVTAQDNNNTQTYSVIFMWSAPSLRNILDGTSTVPNNLSEYDDLTQAVLAPYSANATLVARYVTISGGAAPQGGLSWSDAASSLKLKDILDGINDAGSDRVYLILVASGATTDASYNAGSEMTMKNHVAIIGGWDASGDWGRSGTTVLSGRDSHRVFNNNVQNDASSLLYGVTITAGRHNSKGGGMYNLSASPTLINIIFSDNSAQSGGGMYNQTSFPTLANIMFSDNSADYGGGIYNDRSAPDLNNIVFSANTATQGGGMNNNNSSLDLNNITLSDNSADKGGGMYSEGSSVYMTNITLSGNSATKGGGMYNLISAVAMTNITLSGNSATQEGGGIYAGLGGIIQIVNSIFWGNTAASGAQIYSDNTMLAELTIAYSVIAGGAPDNITTSTNLVTTDPSLADLSIETGSLVATMAIDGDSSAKDAGVYVRRHDYTDQSGDEQTAWYYSVDDNNWYSDFTSDTETTGGLITSVTLPEDSIDITATDATGTARRDRPDAGAYEAR